MWNIYCPCHLLVDPDLLIGHRWIRDSRKTYQPIKWVRWGNLAIPDVTSGLLIKCAHFYKLYNKTKKMIGWFDKCKIWWMLVVQLTAPRGLEIHRMPEAINITWESGYENHPYLRNSLDYELLISRKLDSSKRMVRSTATVAPKTQFIPTEISFFFFFFKDPAKNF